MDSNPHRIAVEPPRPLSGDEVTILNHLLAEDFEGVGALRQQVHEAVVVGRCPCGCPTIDLRVPDSAPSAPFTQRLAPIEGRITSPDDEVPGEIILFLDAGRLSSMEYVWYTDRPPTHWPDPADMTVVRLSR